jgi:hypothetical protein
VQRGNGRADTVLLQKCTYAEGVCVANGGYQVGGSVDGDFAFADGRHPVVVAVTLILRQQSTSGVFQIYHNLDFSLTFYVLQF